MDTYGHLFPDRTRGRWQHFADMRNGPQGSSGALQATGTDDAAAEMIDGPSTKLPAYRQQWTYETTHKTAGTGKADQDAQNETDNPNVLAINGLRGDVLESTGRFPSEVAGTRTQDLRIKSPLLYRLSYNLGIVIVVEGLCLTEFSLSESVGEVVQENSFGIRFGRSRGPIPLGDRAANSR